MDVEALLIIEVEGSDTEMDAQLARIVAIAREHGVSTVKESKSAMEAAAIWKGRKSAFGATGRIADYICMDGTIPTGQLPYVLRRMEEIVKGYGLRVANVFHAGDGNLHPLSSTTATTRWRRRRPRMPAWTSSSSASRWAAASPASMAWASRSATS